jgi:hypothetical protein
MSYAKAIWNEVTSCRYKTSKSFGAYDDCKIVTYTGSSSQNSTELCTIEYRRKIYRTRVVFNMYIDGKLFKQNVHIKKDGRAGGFIETRYDNFVNSQTEKKEND